MKTLIVSLFVVAALMTGVYFATSQESELRAYDKHYDWASFVEYMQTYNKLYENEVEMMMRFGVFLKNKAEIHTHNSMLLNWTQAINQFTDMTQQEFEVKVLCDMQGFSVEESPAEHDAVTGESKDWVDEGFVTNPKNQGQCGSCWSFSTTGSLEGAYKLAKGSLKSFSESQLVDCSSSYGNYGCSGGLMINAYKYLMKYGAELESDYPYVAQERTCKYDSSKVAAKVSTYKTVSRSESALKSASAAHVVSVAVDASTWSRYGKGVLPASQCGRGMNHGVTLVGYGAEGSNKFWKVKNSWGGSWGESGFIRVERTDGSSTGACAIAQYANYPVVA